MFLTVQHLADGATPTGSATLATAQTLRRATAIWLGMLVIAFVNGAIRELAIKHIVAEPWAHHLSALTAILFFTAWVWTAWPWLRIVPRRTASWLGIYWFSLTALTEAFVIGRLLGHQTWPEILAAYDLGAGSLWPLVLLWIALLPTQMRKLRAADDRSSRSANLESH